MVIKMHLAWPAICPLQYAAHVEQQKPAVCTRVPFGVLIKDLEMLASVGQNAFNDLQEIENMNCSPTTQLYKFLCCIMLFGMQELVLLLKFDRTRDTNNG